MHLELLSLFDVTMLPKTRAAAELGHVFAHWLIAELHERGVRTVGFGRIDPKRLYAHFNTGKALLQRCLTTEDLFYLLARTFFYNKPRTPADAELCLTAAKIAQVYGLIGTRVEESRI